MRLGTLGLGFWGVLGLAAGPSTPLAAAPLCLGGGVSLPLSAYIKTPLRGELDTSGLRELLGRALLSSYPHAPPLFPLSPVWLPEGLRRSEGDFTTAQRSVAGILDRIQTDLLPQSRLDPRSGRSHRSSYVYEYYKVLGVWHYVVAPVLSHWHRGVEIFTTLRSATSSSSSMLVRERNPRVRSTRVCHRVSS
jgi:hypothetical protein